MAPTRREILKATMYGGTLMGVSTPATPHAALPTAAAKALMESFGLSVPIFQAPHGRQTSPAAPILRKLFNPCLHRIGVFVKAPGDNYELDARNVSIARGVCYQLRRTALGISPSAVVTSPCR